MTCKCWNCGWAGSADALDDIQDFEERMGVASEYEATYGITVMPGVREPGLFRAS